MRLSRLEKAQRAAGDTSEAVVRASLNYDLLVQTILGGPPSETQRAFIFSPNRIAWFTGPYGSGKTGALVCSVVLPALIYPDSKWFVARETYWTLQETTLGDFERYILRLGSNIVVDRQKGPPYKVWLASGLRKADGRPEEPSLVVFHSLDDMDKLGSTQFSGVAVDEANEIQQPIAAALDGRLRHRREHYEMRPEGPFFLRFASNPVRRSHWLHQYFCAEPDCKLQEPWGIKFKSKPYENAANLPPNYYEDIGKGMTQEQKLRFVLGECGPDPKGDGVYSEFRPEMHVKEGLKYDPKFPLIRGWDFGRRRPAVVWAQLVEGQLRRLAAMMGDNISLERFYERVMNRTSMQFFEAREFLDYCDPSGNQKRDVSEETSISILQKKGLNPRWRDVKLETGIELVGKGLTTLTSKGEARSVFDRANCSLLIEGYLGGYCWPKPTALREVHDKPFKDGFYEHLMDADRYIETCIALGPTAPYANHKRTLRRQRSGESSW